MGISTRPIEDWCSMDNGVFPPGKTPRTITVSVLDVGTAPGVPFGPHCGTFLLEQISATLWYFADPDPQPDWTYPVDQRICRFSMDINNTSCYYIFYHFYSYQYGYSGGVFYKSTPLPLIMYGKNQYTYPLDPYYDGFYQAKWRATAAVFGSLAADSVLAGMEASNKDLYEPSTADDTAESMRFSRRRDHSCIYMRKER